MRSFIRKLLGLDAPVQEFLGKEPVVLDVRTHGEYERGHVAGSRHIPLHELKERLAEVKSWKAPVLTCCATGRRSGIAAQALTAQGIEAFNGGGWRRVNRIVKDHEKSEVS